MMAVTRSLLIRFAVIMAYASAPIFMIGLGWGFFLISQNAPIWVFLVLCVSGVIVALGFACLLDTRNPLPPRQQDDR